MHTRSRLILSRKGKKRRSDPLGVTDETSVSFSTATGSDSALDPTEPTSISCAHVSAFLRVFLLTSR